MIELTDELESAILHISEAMKKLNEKRLHRKAIITLISDHSKVGKKTVEVVLNNLEFMERTWLKPKK